MANTWIVTPLQSEERLAQFRSVDFDPCELYERHGEPLALFDLTDELRPLGFITPDKDDIGRFVPYDNV